LPEAAEAARCGLCGIGSRQTGLDSAPSATAGNETRKLLHVNNMRNTMWLLMVEAVFAFFLLVFIVWWTMYSGRKPDRPAAKKRPPSQAKEPAKRPD
jgi:hypothetical protein